MKISSYKRTAGWIVISVCCSLFACGPSASKRDPLLRNPEAKDTSNQSLYTTEQAEDLPAKAEEAALFLKHKEFTKLASLIHPEIGVWFSPYGYVDTANHLHVSQEWIRHFWEDTETYTWGSYDGSGDPIVLKPSEYYAKFIYDKDFASAPNIVKDSVLGKGNSLLNYEAMFPDARFVEFYFPGENQEYGGMDWKSLRLFFKEIEGTFYLIAIVHDQWTI